MIEPLREELDLACDAAHAFATWTGRFGSCWPRGHTASGDATVELRLEPWVGGLIYERAPDGTEIGGDLDYFGKLSDSRSVRVIGLRILTSGTRAPPDPSSACSTASAERRGSPSGAGRSRPR